MTRPEHIRQTAEGMIRNFGLNAAQEAVVVALRHVKPTRDGYELWLAVAQEIREIQPPVDRASHLPAPVGAAVAGAKHDFPPA